MTTLRIEHAITSYETWRGAFDRAAPIREQVGVRGYRIQRPIDDPNYLMIDLDFDDVTGAEALLSILRERIWANPENSPGLGGQPVARIVETVDAT
ncbi:MAG TPA: hypothetical protein VM030_09130 [Acidimicrobiales bacterium]|nr:hypothetical protein [Acidimicrobiales bacterium]